MEIDDKTAIPNIAKCIRKVSVAEIECLFPRLLLLVSGGGCMFFWSVLCLRTNSRFFCGSRSVFLGSVLKKGNKFSKVSSSLVFFLLGALCGGSAFVKMAWRLVCALGDDTVTLILSVTVRVPAARGRRHRSVRGVRRSDLVWLCNRKICRVLKTPKGAKGGWVPRKTTGDFGMSLVNAPGSPNDAGWLGADPKVDCSRLCLKSQGWFSADGSQSETP